MLVYIIKRFNIPQELLMYRLFTLLILTGLLVFPNWTTAQEALVNSAATTSWAPEPIPPKREFRGVWIATVFNTDYPKSPSPLRVAIKEQYKNLIGEFKRLGFNAVVVQVRPAGDSFYPSLLVPWSKFLTGKQGKAPIPEEFDPLEFMIEETHRLGMEFHAWMNPYRATVNLDTAGLDPKHVFYQHRDWLLTYGTRMYLNPGVPEVRKHIVDVVGEVVDNYDIDGIHFDDYFYPYKIKDVPFPDSATYYFYGQAFKNIDDWRRTNTDNLIMGVSQRIRAVKPNVKFGISPFGVWSNRSQNTMGSETAASVTSYDDLYADGIKWLKNGWIDYIAPQLYWNIGYPPADYAELVKWWSMRVKEQHLYIGQAAYKVGDNPEPQWQDPKEIPRQITMNRNNVEVDGSIFYSAQSIKRNLLGVKDSLRTAFKNPALVPQIDYQSGRVPKVPRFNRVRSKSGDVKLKWKPNKDDTYIKPAYYVVYRFDGPSAGDYEDPRNILHVTSFMAEAKKMVYMDRSAEAGNTYTYVVAAVNRQHQEGRPSDIQPVLKTEKRVKKVKRRRVKKEKDKRSKKEKKLDEATPDFRF